MADGAKGEVKGKEAMLADSSLAKGEIDMDMEKLRLGKLREAHSGCQNWEKLKPASLKGINWKETKQVTYLQEAGVIVAELANDQAVIINGNTHNAVHSVVARGILQTMHMKHMPSKVVQPMQMAEWDEMIRSVVNIAEEEKAASIIEFVTGKALSKEDFGLSPASAWQREVLIVGEFRSSACRQPFLAAAAGGEAAELTQEQLEDIGQMCAVDLLFNNTKILAEQIGLMKVAEGEKVTSTAQYVNAEPDGLKRNGYIGLLGELLEAVFREAKQDEALEQVRKVFWWGDVQLTNEQLAHVMNGLRTGCKAIASPSWTKESLTKLVTKTFRNVKEEIGMASLEEILDFLSVVQEEIKDIVEGVTTIVGMCGAKSVVSIAVDF